MQGYTTGLATNADLANIGFFGWLKPLQFTYGVRHTYGGSAVMVMPGSIDILSPT